MTAATAATQPPGARVALRVLPARPHAGAPMRLRLREVDGAARLRLHVCLVSPAGSLPCEPARVGPRAAKLQLQAPRPGAWTVRVEGRGTSIERHVVVRPAGRQLKVLAAGDSLMEPVARALESSLASPGVRVRGDILLGAGLSAPFVGDWRRRARRAGAGWRPDVVVLFLGGADSFPFGSVECCGRRWARIYAARARTVARRYSRHGAAQVYWLTLPAPRDPIQTATWKVINAARARGLRGLAPLTRELDTSALLTPGFVFRRDMPIDGVPTTIRQPDGVHLTDVAGGLVAFEVTSALAVDGIVAQPAAGSSERATASASARP